MPNGRMILATQFATNFSHTDIHLTWNVYRQKVQFFFCFVFYIFIFAMQIYLYPARFSYLKYLTVRLLPVVLTTHKHNIHTNHSNLKVHFYWYI